MGAFDDLIPKKSGGSFDDLVPVNPTEGMPWWQKALAGAGKAFVDTGRGVQQIASYAGLGDKQAIQQEIDQAKERDTALMDTGAGLAGNIGGNLATMIGPTAALGAVGKVAHAPALVNAARAAMVPNTVKGAAAGGAALGGIQPVASDESRIANVGLGAAGGAAGNLIPKALGRAVSPNISADVQTLMREGVTPTPGQILGGAAQRIEDGLTSVPIMGDSIKAAQRRAIEGFNKAAINRALGKIGESADSVGNEGVEEAAKKIGAQYNAILPKLTAKADDEFLKTVITQVQEVGQNLPPERAKQFKSLVQHQVLNKFDDVGQMPGEKLKQVQSTISRLARGYSKSEDMDARSMGYALESVEEQLRGMVRRSNPEFAEGLQAADEAWANFVRVRRAAAMQGAKEGLFTPAQLRSAVRASDSSVQKGDFAKGKSLMQDLTDAGEKVLGSKVPDSGTPFRLNNVLMGAGGYYLDPSILGGTLLGAGAYTPPAQKALAALLTKRPKKAGLLGDQIEGTAPYLSAPGSSYLLSE
jgi:hypothetical protein